MSYQSFNEAWDALPKPHQNNARSIIRSWIKKFKESPCGYWQQKIEDVLGIDIDFSEADHGEGPAEDERELEE